MKINNIENLKINSVFNLESEYGKLLLEYIQINLILNL